MYIKVCLRPKDGNRNIRIPVRECQKQMNSYVHHVLGPDNPYHDRFSHYNISELLGMKIDPKTNEYYLDERSVPRFTVSVYNDEPFLENFIEGLYRHTGDIFGLVFDYMELNEFHVHDYCDKIVTTSPILLKVNDIKISVEDEGFIEQLTQHCIKKLQRSGIVDKTFSLKIRRPDRARKKLKWVGGTWNICSNVSLRVAGKPETRRALYQLGLGCSTGSGFGSVLVFD